MTAFKPPYPKPHRNRWGFLKAMVFHWNSWIHWLYERNYTMKMGHLKLPWIPRFLGQAKKRNIYKNIEHQQEIFVVNDIDDVRRILNTEADKFPKHRLMGEMMEPLLGESIFTTNGAVWKRQREMMDTAFVNARLKKVFPLMTDAIADMMERFDTFDENKDILVDEEMTYITADIIFRTILSHPLKGKEAELIFNAFNVFQDKASKAVALEGLGFSGKKNKAVSDVAAKEIKSVLAPIIRERFEAYQKGEDKIDDDILAALMQARDKNTGEGFDYPELTDHVSMLFLAGHETSASALTWSLYLIANCPDVQDKMYAEINEVCGDREIAYTDIRKLTFINNVFKEALRLYPPVGAFMREAGEDLCLRGSKARKGAHVVVSPWIIQRHRKQWRDPDLFMPDRFAAEDSETKTSIKCSYFPFSKGPRVCVGMGFALQEAALILANLVRRFEFANKPGHVPKPVSRVTIRPENGVKLMTKKRTT